MDIVESIKQITARDAPLMKPAKEYKQQTEGHASAFLIDIEPGRLAYRYDVNVVLKSFNSQTGQEYEKNFAKGPDEGMRARNRNLCYDILVSAFNRYDPQYGFFGQPGGELVYDCKSTMYTNMPLAIEQEISFQSNESSDFVRTYCSEGTFYVSIHQNQSGHVLALDDFMQYINKETIHHEDRSIRTFLEMAVAQYGINNFLYVPIGPGKLFEDETQENAQLKEVGNGMVLRSGIAKGVRIVRGEEGDKPVPALVIDVKVSPFFINQNLATTVKQMGPGGNSFPNNDRGWDDVACLLQDIRVEFKPKRNRTFSIKELSSGPASAIKVTHRGQQMTVEEYFRAEYGHELEFPKLRCVIPDFEDRLEEGSPDRFFPLEMLIIMPDQRVPLQKMSARLSQELLTANSLPPQQRYARVIEHCERLNLFSNNPVLSAFGIKILTNSNKCKINIRASPNIRFRDGSTVSPDQKADWKRASVGKQYFSSEEIYNWIIIHPKECERDVQNFAKKFVDGARHRGMSFRDTAQFWPCNGRSWADLFDECVAKDIQFVVLIDPKNEDTHGILKYYEARKKILTQHITFERVKDVLGSPKGRQTLENILNKTNMKYSGLNYLPIFERAAGRFCLDRNETLVLGYDVAQPPPMSTMERRQVQTHRKDLLSFDPSVVGITANMAPNPHNFVGDYYFQEALREGLDCEQLADRFAWILKTLANMRPEAGKPKYIFVIRNGLSEGQFAESVQSELQALRKGCELYDTDYSPQFVYILGTKRHYKKFYAGENPKMISNLVPGSVVDSKFVREDCPEFFMQSHFALKGVGKPVAYNVLYDDIHVSKDEVEGLLNSLCYSHQIVNSAVSMPEPIYQADELAKRGRNNYTTMKRLEQSQIPRKPPHNFVDFKQLNEMLTYKDNPIFITTRFTA